MKLKNFNLLFAYTLIIIIFVSCGPAVPKKELEDAKTALERARSAEAHIYAENEFKDAENDYNIANKYVSENKNQEAKEKALSSKDKSDKSYNLARKNKAIKIIDQVQESLNKINTNRIIEEVDFQEYQNVKNEVENLKNLLSKEDYDNIFNNAPKVEEKIKVFIDKINKLYAEKFYKDAGESIEKLKEKKLDTIFVDKFAEITKKYEEITPFFEKQDYENIINLSTDVINSVKNAFDEFAKIEKEAKDKLVYVQDKYEAAKNNNLVSDYALSELQQALPYIDKAKISLEINPIESLNNSKEAEKIIDNAIKLANEKYNQEIQKKRESDKLIEMQRQKEIEEQKKRALEYIEQAKERLQKLKSRKKSGFLELKMNEFAFIESPFINFGQSELEQSIQSDTVSKPQDYKTKSIKKVSDENVTIDLVEEYLNLAIQAYENEEYLDAIDYARESIRMADILIAMEEYKTYIVKLNPANRDCLWKISGYMYKNKTWLWPIIWRANKFQIKDPDLIYPGQELKIPPAFVK